MPAASLAGRPNGLSVCECRHGRPEANGWLQVHIHEPAVSPVAQHVSAPMDRILPGTESLAPQILATSVSAKLAAVGFEWARAEVGMI